MTLYMACTVVGDLHVHVACEQAHLCENLGKKKKGEAEGGGRGGGKGK